MRKCRQFIQENGKIWKEDESRRKEESEKVERLKKAGVKKKAIVEQKLQRKLMEKWTQLPDKEKIKYREEEEKGRRIEMEEVRENLWRW